MCGGVPFGLPTLTEGMFLVLSERLQSMPPAEPIQATESGEQKQEGETERILGRCGTKREILSGAKEKDKIDEFFSIQMLIDSYQGWAAAAGLMPHPAKALMLDTRCEGSMSTF